jgi:hypothetical protein
MTAPRVAFARLMLQRRKRSAYVWIVDRCPHCGQRHYHSGGRLYFDDPDTLLGERIPFGCPPYVLVRDPNANHDAQLPVSRHYPKGELTEGEQAIIRERRTAAFRMELKEVTRSGPRTDKKGSDSETSTQGGFQPIIRGFQTQSRKRKGFRNE